LTDFISHSICVKQRDVTHKNKFIVKGRSRDEERQPLEVKGRKDLFRPHTEKCGEKHKYRTHADETTKSLVRTYITLLYTLNQKLLKNHLTETRLH